MDLGMSMGCDQYPDIDICMTCYDLGYRNIEVDNQSLAEEIKQFDITPRNIMRYRSVFPYYYHCINNGKAEAFYKSINNTKEMCPIQNN